MGRLLKRKPSVKKKKTQSQDRGKPSDNGAASRGDKKGVPIESKADDPKRGRSRSASIRTVSGPLKKSPPAGPIRGHIGKALQFLREVRAELRKVTWPSRKQTAGSTLVVLILVMIISLFLGMVDFCLSGLIRMIL